MGVVPHSAAEGEKGHRHSGEPHGLHGFRDVGGDDPQVFRQEGRGRKFLPYRIEKVRRGDRPPGSPLGGFVSERDGPVGEKAPEMVDSHRIEQGEGMTESPDPPGETVLFQRVPVVEGVAPELPRFAEIIGRHSRHFRGQKIPAQAEKGLAGPYVGAVVVHVDGKIADKLHPCLPAFRPEALHLGEENVLDEPQIIQLPPEIPGGFPQGRFVPSPDLFRPAVPGSTFVDSLEGSKENVVFEPVLLFPEEGPVFLAGGKTGKSDPEDFLPERPCRAVVYAVFRKGWMAGEFVPEEQTPCDKIIRGYAQGVARESRR